MDLGNSTEGFQSFQFGIQFFPGQRPLRLNFFQGFEMLLKLLFLVPSIVKLIPFIFMTLSFAPGYQGFVFKATLGTRVIFLSLLQLFSMSVMKRTIFLENFGIEYQSINPGLLVFRQCFQCRDIVRHFV